MPRRGRGHTLDIYRRITVRRKTYLTWLSLIGGAAIGVAGVVSLGAYYAHRVVTPLQRPAEPLRVIEVNRKRRPHSVRFTKGEDSALLGRYSFIFDQGEGHVRLGAILAEDSSTVTRELLKIDRGVLRVGARGRVTGWWYVDPKELGFKVIDTVIPTELGPFATWVITPENPAPGRFAVHVHGRGAQREETLRGVSPFARAGVTSLVASYRNDPEAPESLDGRFGLGWTESKDVESTIAAAVKLGATSITLVGWSMGATACLLAAEHSDFAHLIDGIVLESPALSWPELLAHQARISHVPQASMRVAVKLITSGARVTGLGEALPIHSLTAKRFSTHLRVPTLVHVSESDTFVPFEPALEFAMNKPDLVTLNRQKIGEHVKLWNVEPARWEETTEDFVRNLRSPQTVDQHR